VFDPWLRGAERERERTKAAVLSPACGTHQGEGGREGGGGTMGEGEGSQGAG